MIRILLIEDDSSLAKGIALSLQETEREIVIAGTIAEAKSHANSEFDLFILDVNLPDGSGLDFCIQLRKCSNVPILFLTANDTELDIVAGLECGGDDYLTKPFSLAILRARVNVLLRRRARFKQDAEEARKNGFQFDFANMRFLKNGEPMDLSKTEQKLLHLLWENRGQTLTRELLLARIWPDGSDYVDENALSVAVRRLRGKLEDKPSTPHYIKTVYGIGYTWAVES